jgi:hypothetical protein
MGLGFVGGFVVALSDVHPRKTGRVGVLWQDKLEGVVHGPRGANEVRDARPAGIGDAERRDAVDPVRLVGEAWVS